LRGRVASQPRGEKRGRVKGDHRKSSDDLIVYAVKKEREKGGKETSTMMESGRRSQILSKRGDERKV